MNRYVPVAIVLLLTLAAALVFASVSMVRFKSIEDGCTEMGGTYTNGTCTKADYFIHPEEGKK